MRLGGLGVGGRFWSVWCFEVEVCGWKCGGLTEWPLRDAKNGPRIFSVCFEYFFNLFDDFLGKNLVLGLRLDFFLNKHNLT